MSGFISTSDPVGQCSHWGARGKFWFYTASESKSNYRSNTAGLCPASERAKRVPPLPWGFAPGAYILTIFGIFLYAFLNWEVRRMNIFYLKLERDFTTFNLPCFFSFLYTAIASSVFFSSNNLLFHCLPTLRKLSYCLRGIMTRSSFDIKFFGMVNIFIFYILNQPYAFCKPTRALTFPLGVPGTELPPPAL